MEILFQKLDETIGKTQEVRLLDVFALAPFMVWFGLAAKKMPEGARIIMVLSGIGTALYNWRNYLIEKKKINRNI